MAKPRKANKGIVLIRKSNNLIESRYKFDIWETRFFLSVLGQIRREDEDFEVYRVWYKDVIKAFKLKSGDSYGLLRSAAQSLMGKSFFVNYEENGAIREKQYHILREIDYLKAGQEGRAENHEYIDVTVEQKMRPLLLQLQRNFTAYDLRNILKLGVYPVRVYELLKQYESIGHRTLQVEEMKRMFEVSEQYKLFADFFRWVVSPAVKEINKHTDLIVSKVEKVKEGKRVVALHFVFHLKPAEEIRKMRGEKVQHQHHLDFDFQRDANAGSEVITTVLETEKDRLFNLFHAEVVQKFGVTPSVFLELLEGHTEEEINQAARVTRRAKANNQIKSSLAGFFVQALKGGYTDPKEEEAKRKMELERQRVGEELIKPQIEALKDEQAIRINERIREVTNEEPAITERAIQDLQLQYRAVIEKKEKKLGRLLEIEDYRQDRELREMVKGKIVELAKDRFTDIFKEAEEKMRALQIITLQ
jgi:plasmid replication initiation protein